MPLWWVFYMYRVASIKLWHTTTRIKYKSFLEVTQLPPQLPVPASIVLFQRRTNPSSGALQWGKTSLCMHVLLHCWALHFWPVTSDYHNTSWDMSIVFVSAVYTFQSFSLSCCGLTRLIRPSISSLILKSYSLYSFPRILWLEILDWNLNEDWDTLKCLISVYCLQLYLILHLLVQPDLWLEDVLL